MSDAADRPAPSPLFEHLVASRGPREPRGAAAAASAAALFHLGLIAGLVWATTADGTPPRPTPEPDIVVLPVEEMPVPRVPEPPRPVAPPTGAPTGPAETYMPAPPVVPPPTVPPIDADQPFITDPGDAGTTSDPSARREAGTARNGGEPDLSVVGVFVPHTVEPRLLEAGAAAHALERAYPPLLRDASIGGTVNLWLLVDEDGKVLDAPVQATSGHAALDDAALDVARHFRFTPAFNGDRKVKVWISIPVQFEAR